MQTGAQLKTLYEQRSRTTERLCEVAELVENKMQLIGASAIEDELQDSVPDTIKALRDAGIQVWVATGDKIETSINIALSARLLDSNMYQMVLSSDDQEELVKQIDSALDLLTIFDAKTLHDVELDLGDPHSNNGVDSASLLPEGYVTDILALIVSGKSLEVLLKSQKGTENTEKKLMALANVCEVVLACRVSPAQKALLVKMVGKPRVNNKLSPVSLAIGDGANDAPMIQKLPTMQTSA